MVESEVPDEHLQDAYECTGCGQRLDGPRDSCDDPFCDGAAISVATGRE